MKNWQRWHGARSHGNNSISCFVQMPQCITKSKYKRFLIVWLISSHRKARQVAVLIFKLRQGASIRANVGRSVGLSVEKIKKSKNQILWLFLIIWLILGFGGVGRGGLGVHNDYLPEMFFSWTLTFVEVGCMYIISINQRIKRIKLFDFFDFFDFLNN